MSQAEARRPRRRELSDAERTRLAEQNVPLVQSIVRRYRLSGMPAEDLFQYGMLGLLYAVDYYDPASGYAFSTYASICVRGHILSGIREVRSRDLFIPSGEFWQREQARKAGDLQAFPPPALSLDARRYGEDGTATLQDCLPGSDLSPEQLLLAAEQAAEYDRLTEAVLQLCSPTEATVLRGRYLCEPRLKYRELAAELGCSHQHVQDVERRALRRLRSLCASGVV